MHIALCAQVVDKWRYAGEESSEREIRILSKVQHENCIRMHAVFVTSRRVYIVTDLVTGGELLDKCALPMSLLVTVAVMDLVHMCCAAHHAHLHPTCAPCQKPMQLHPSNAVHAQ